MPRRLWAIAFGTTSRAFVFGSAIVALLLFSCSESKVSQCQKIINVTKRLEPLKQEFHAEMTSLQKSSRPKDIAEVKAMFDKASTIFQTTANKFIKIGQATRAVEVSDEKLKAWKTRYANLLDKYQFNLNNLSNLLLEANQVNKVSDFSNKYQQLERDGSVSFEEIHKLETERQKLERELQLHCQTK